MSHLHVYLNNTNLILNTRVVSMLQINTRVYELQELLM